MTGRFVICFRRSRSAADERDVIDRSRLHAGMTKHQIYLPTMVLPVQRGMVENIPDSIVKSQTCAVRVCDGV